MKLIDILLQELPKRGGWPEDSNEICQSNQDTEIYTSSEILRDFYVDRKAEDCGIYNGVQRQQYELALQETIWDGVGLPPVGARIEVNSPSSGWTKVTVTAVKDNWLVAQYEDGAELASTHRILERDGSFTNSTHMFRKLKTEAERQHEASIADLQESLKESGYGLPDGAAEILLEAIAQGKVSGIKLAD